MLIGSHNSISYARPKKWWMYPFRFIARCQSKSIKEQYEKYDVRLFDLRIKFNKGGNVCFAHGAMEYDVDINEVLSYLNSIGDIPVRILLENKAGEYEEEFKQWCREARKSYPKIKFFGGRNKYSWKEVFKFKYKGPSYTDKYSSNNSKSGKITGTYLDDWFPFLYAFFNNKKNIEKGTEAEYLLIDFVEIK